MKKRKWLYLSTIVVLFVCLIIFLVIPYGRVEKLTRKYGNEFKERYIDNGFYSDIEYLKVIKYRTEQAEVYGIGDYLEGLTDNQAVVLYVEENHSSASLFIFTYSERWEMESWHTVWSISGSADDFMWPYYP